MKAKLILAATLSLMSISAFAGDCETLSNDLPFASERPVVDDARSATIADCQNDSRTSNYQCEANIRCNEDRVMSPRPGGQPGQGPGQGGPQHGSGGPQGPGMPQGPGNGGGNGHPQPQPQPFPMPHPQPIPHPQPPPQQGPVWGNENTPANARCYLERYPDICQNSPKNYCRNPWNHYMTYGRFEGRIWGCQ